mgnify:CR=1 FL=1
MRARNVLCLVMALMMAVSVCLAEETPSLKDDFYAVVNAEWLEQTEIPSDAPEVSVFSELGDQVQEVLKADFQAMLDGEATELEGFTVEDDRHFTIRLEYWRRTMKPAMPWARSRSSRTLRGSKRWTVWTRCGKTWQT